MKNSKLFIGLGVGLLVGAALAVYFVTDDETKAEWVDDINSTIDKAKKKIGRVVEDGIDELDAAKEKVTQAAESAIAKVKKA